MSRPLRILIVEDSEDDALLLLRELRRGGFDPTWACVDTAEGMRAALARGPWDLIVSDHHLPAFDSFGALAIYREHGEDLPFIIVSGTIGEEVAVGAMKAGAHDYILKGNLHRLAPAVERELREAETRRARRRAEADLREMAAHLEQRVAQRTAELEERERETRAARREADRANRAKSEFLSRMSHELRTPLNAILGFGQLLEMDDPRPEQAPHIGYILRAGHHLLDLINEVLDIARIEAGRLTLSIEPVPLRAAVEEAVELITPLAAQRQIGVANRLDAADARHVMADRQRIKQVLLNLLSNGVKYNREGGALTVEVREHDGRLRVMVTDTGPGIPAGRVHSLFVPFERLDPERTDVEGTGLGLAVSKGLVEAMGGRIGVESEAGRGSTFWFELALAPSPTAAVMPAEADAGGPGSPRARAGSSVLYIEDNPSNIELFERILARRPGVRLLTALHGGTGLDLAREHRPDLILIDLHLPDATGDEIIARLAADGRTARLPVVMMTATRIRSRQAERYRAMGVVDILSKPLDVQRLLELIDTVLGKEVRPEG